MMVVGLFKAISGIIGLFNSEWIMRGFENYYFVDISALAWWYLIVGVPLTVAGWAVLVGQKWGRWVGARVPTRASTTVKAAKPDIHRDWAEEKSWH